MNSFAILGVPILTFLTFFPTVGALLILLLPSSKPRTVRIAALVVSLLTFAASIPWSALRGWPVWASATTWAWTASACS